MQAASQPQREHTSMGNKEQHPKKEVKKPKKDKKK